MAYGKVNIDTIQSSTAGTPPQFNDGNGTQTGTLCRAWVNFNGTGTVAIRGSFNVSSITDNGTGDYTINFTTALPDANYSATGSMNTNSSGANAFYPNTYSSSSFRFYTTIPGAGVTDPTIVSVAVFR
jgi:hypothetical protein